MIHTPTARLEVLGTRFDLDSDTANTRLMVNEGRVRMTRLVDGRVADVPALHEAMASLTDADMAVLPRRQPEILWRSDFGSGPAGTQGRWLPADAARSARAAAEPVYVPKSSRGPVTIHRVGLSLPWQKLAYLAPFKGNVSEIDLSMSVASRADLEKLRSDHPGPKILTITPEEIVKRHKLFAANLAKQAPAELAAPLKAALEKAK